ncbi:MAG TPA: hypothetical protein VNZ26_26685 [Vicinamibacterales bacterium]|jgi:hypothetical protein|nr:hypothetical protein [Vicinamibacterales bacterium]
MTDSETKTYVVHLYREVRVSFYGIRATSDEDAASRARLLRTDRGEISHSDTTDFCALVDSEDDDDLTASRVITFEDGRLRDVAPKLMDALLDIKLLAQKHADNGFDPYYLLEEIEQKALATLAKAKGGAQ